MRLHSSPVFLPREETETRGSGAATATSRSRKNCARVLYLSFWRLIHPLLSECTAAHEIIFGCRQRNAFWLGKLTRNAFETKHD